MAAGEPSGIRSSYLGVQVKTGNENGKLKVKTWRSRRRLAIIALAWIIVETLLLFYTVPVEKLAVLKEPITWSYFVCGGIITAYMGFKAFGKEKMDQG